MANETSDRTGEPEAPPMSNEVPDKPGWYYARWRPGPGGGRGIEHDGFAVVFVADYGGELEVFVVDAGATFKLDHFDWLGPVPPPAS